ncbi:helix-turn-helix domain-containing protein [Thermomonas aquatica]|nr:DNA-binding transcriptional regulator [Thermomonas aquatica]
MTMKVLKKPNDVAIKKARLGPKARRAKVTMVKVKAVRKSASPILASIHETMSGLHKAGVVKVETMREFDKLCLEPVVKFAGAQIAALRKREKVSQPVFAMYLNVSKSSVAQWESGEKNPDGPALKLLNLVQRKGLEVLA